tara:strand:+ start:2100 stop:2303 length:204 start_codon:yes stop_codon:yes gene_type:complete
MRNIPIINKQLQINHEELEILEDFVEKQNGKICWGLIKESIEKGDKEMDTLWHINKSGIIATPLKHI